jgi:cell wall-associated NlpC family hydrolase
MINLNDLIGKPFRDGGRGPEAYDCWGLVKEVFRRHGIEVKDYWISCRDSMAINQAFQDDVRNWVRVSKDQLQPPALVVIKFNQPVYCNHTGVYIGAGRFIHAREKVGVCIEPVEHPVWKRTIEGFYMPGWC